MSVPAGNGNTAPGLTTATILFFLWAFLTYLVRVWAKLKQSDTWGSDDYASSLAMAAALANVITTCYAVHRGYGNPWDSLDPSDRATIHNALFASQTFYILSVGFTKMSTSFFTVRFLTRDQRNTKVAHGLTAVCALWAIVSVFVVAIRNPISHPWTLLDGSEAMYSRWLGVEIAGFAIDVSLLGLCLACVWILQMPISKRLAVSTIFACRLAVAPLVVMRLIYLSPSFHANRNTASPNVNAGVFTEAVMEGAFILSSITCLKPFLRPFHGGYFVSSNATPLNGRGYGTHVAASALKNSRTGTYYELSGARSQNERERRIDPTLDSRETNIDDERDDLDLIQPHDKPPLLRPDRVMQRSTNVTSSPGFNGADRDHISKTQVWSVKYEER